MSDKVATKLAREDLERSGIPRTALARRHFIALASDATKGYTKTFNQPGLLIPYFNPVTEEFVDTNEFWRIRFLKEPILNKAEVFNKKNKNAPMRYMQLPGTDPRAYFAPSLPSWPAVLQNVSTSIIITEGEKKAYKACMEGFPTIGLGGVWNFQTKRQPLNKNLIPDLFNAKWRNRKISVIYDSDITDKPEVEQALLALTAHLQQEGAVVTRVDLPKGIKGLDDYLVLEGVRGLNNLLKTADIVIDNTDLKKLNKRLAVVNGCKLFDTQTNSFISPHEFSIFRGAFGQRTSLTLQGKVTTQPIFDAWLEWPERRSVAGVTYQPNRDEIVHDRINTWKASAIQPKKGNVGPFLKALTAIFKKEDKQKLHWFLQWAAYPFQHPESPKMFSAVVIWSQEQGTGKSTLGYFLNDLYGENGVELTHDNLTGSFDYFYEKQFILVNEAVGGEYPGKIADKLKHLVTGEHLTVRKKHQPEYTIDNYANLMFTSNHVEPLRIARNDRRFFVHNVRGATLSHEEWKAINDWRKDVGAAYVLHYLQHEVDLKGFMPQGAALETSDRMEVSLQGESDESLFAQELINDPKTVLGSDLADMKLFTAVQLNEIMKRYMNRPVYQNVRFLTKALKEHGAVWKAVFLRDEQGNKTGPTKNLWCIVDMQAWKRLQEVEWWKEYSRHSLPSGRIPVNRRRTGKPHLTVVK